MAQLRDDIDNHIVTWAEVHRDTAFWFAVCYPKDPGRVSLR